MSELDSGRLLRVTRRTQQHKRFSIVYGMLQKAEYSQGTVVTSDEFLEKIDSYGISVPEPSLPQSTESPHSCGVICPWKGVDLCGMTSVKLGRK